MRRIKLRGITIAALAATTMLGACTDMYLDRRETVSLEAGNASAANKAIQTIDPWPAYAARQDIAYDGERAAAAAERYRTNKVTPPTGIGTSSVKYEQQAPQPVAK
jgi:type IV pilus biogenesis protein CpaD/CtpE